MSKTHSLIAVVATALMVNGERVVVEAGQPLPNVSDKDRDELLASKAAREPITEAADAAPEAATDAAADASADAPASDAPARRKR